MFDLNTVCMCVCVGALIQVPLSAEDPSVAALNDPEKLILISKRSTADSPPEDTPHARQVGWEYVCVCVCMCGWVGGYVCMRI